MSVEVRAASTGEHRVALEHPVLGWADHGDLMQVVHHRDRAEPRRLGGGGDIDDLVEDRFGSDAGVIEVGQMEIKSDGCAHTQDLTHRERPTPRPTPRSVTGGHRSESVNAADARQRFAAVRVARLATVSPAGHPHLVPITFALLGEDMLVSAVDHKPKRTTALQRLANLAARPEVCVLADHYSEDWVQLWWARADGRARVLGRGEEEATRAAALHALIARYDQYREAPPHGAVIVVAVERWSGWSAARMGEEGR